MMEKEELQLRHRLSELASLCFYRNISVFSDFLSLREQEVFLCQSRDFPDISYTLEGCFPDAERKAACFLPKADRWACSGCEEENSAAMEARRFFKLIKIAPVSERFAKECTHRDFLGAILNLGIERGKIGDLFVEGNTCFAVCHPGLAPFLCQELSTVRHNPVTCTEASWDSFSFRPKYTEIRGTVASVRLDSMVSLCLSVSRGKAADLCKSEKVWINGSCISSVSYIPKEGQIISIRGFGKFRLERLENQTRKGRQFVLLLRYE